MSTIVTVGQQNFVIPTNGEVGWASSLTSWITAVSNKIVTPVNFNDFAVKTSGDGIHDDTVELQKWLDKAQGSVGGINGWNYARLPRAVNNQGYRVSSALTYIGGSSYSIKIEGDVAGQGPSGTSLIWVGGSTDETGIMDFQNANYCVIEGISFQGQEVADFLLWYRAKPSPDTSGGTQLVLKNCSFSGPRRTGDRARNGIGLRIGGDNQDVFTRQADQMYAYDCRFGGGLTCVKTLQGGNTKDFYFGGGGFTGRPNPSVSTDYITDFVDWTKASGFLILDHISGGAMRDVVTAGPSQVIINGVQVEGCRRMLTGGSQGDNLGQAVISNCQIIGNGDSTTETDDIAINYSGALEMHHTDIDTSGRPNGGATGLSRVLVGSVNSAAKSFYSHHNVYAGTNVKNFAPIYANSTDLIIGNVPATANPQAGLYKVISEFDMGADTLQGTNLRDLLPTAGGYGGRGNDWASPEQVQLSSNLKVVRHGAPHEGMNEYDVSYPLFSAAATSKTIDLCQLRQGDEISRVCIQIITKANSFSDNSLHSGPISAATMEVGIAGDPDGLLLAADVWLTAMGTSDVVAYGASPTEVGVKLVTPVDVLLNPSGHQVVYLPTHPEGYMPNLTSTSTVTLTLRTTGANTSTITQGKVRVSFHIRRVVSAATAPSL